MNCCGLIVHIGNILSSKYTVLVILFSLYDRFIIGKCKTQNILQSMRVFSIKIRHGPDRVLSISESVSVLWSLPFVHGVS